MFDSARAKYRLLVLISTILLNITAYGQDYFRIRSDFSVKISNSDGTKNLTRGIVYYDKNIRELIYDISFPRPEKWISRDTCLYKFSKDSLIRKVTIPSINEFTIFHLALNSRLNDFGLKNSIYQMNKVEKKGGMVLSYWKIPEKAKISIDHVVVAKKSNRLESVVMVNSDQKIISKQFFRNFIKIDAFEFPSQIIQILYDPEGRESYQVTEFRNIKINDMTNNKLYESAL